MDSTRIDGTKYAVTRSASSCTGTREDWPFSTNSTICDRNDSLPVFVTRTSIVSIWLIVAPITPSFSPLSTGIDSPLTIDSSILVVPRTIVPVGGDFLSRTDPDTVSNGKFGHVHDSGGPIGIHPRRLFRAQLE